MVVENSKKIELGIAKHKKEKITEFLANKTRLNNNSSNSINQNENQRKPTNYPRQNTDKQFGFGGARPRHNHQSNNSQPKLFFNGKIDKLMSTDIN